MLSLGCRDGRKRSGLGLEMEETELEEGEALNYHEEDEDSAIDPDVALSYIEEKLQSVLGHFQKDFEGGVSAENLGAKFGGYGSFLPAYQRSPSCSHARSPAEVPHYDTQKSPRNLHSEDQRLNSRIQVSASPSARSSTTSGKSVSAGRASKSRGSLMSRHTEESNLKSRVIDKSVKHLKLRIKVGLENLSTQKNVEIYDGLGLVVTPSSSLDDSPITDEREHGKILDMPDESPTSILQIMTSYSGGAILSPLSEDLVDLTETKKHRVKHESKNVVKTSIESSGISFNGLLFNKSDQKVVEPKRMKSTGKYKNFAFELADQNNHNNKDRAYSLLKREKEMDIDALGCEKLVSNALKLPLLSSSEHNALDSASNMYAANILSPNASKVGTTGETLSMSVEKEHIPYQDLGRVGKWVGRGSLSKVPESKKEQHFISNDIDPVMDMQMEENVYALDLPERNGLKVGKTLSSAEPFDTSKQLVVQRGGVVREEGFQPAVELSSSGGMKKQKVDQAVASQGECTTKDELIVELSVTPKREKNSSSYFHESKKDSQDLQKDHVKTVDRYKDFFGDIEFEDADDESLTGASSERLKDPHLHGKSSFSDDRSNTKEECNRKSSEKPFPKEKNPRPASRMASHPGIGPSTEAPTGTVPLVNEDWVSCDKCQKWRLLPLGTNPKSLPDKWLCRMLTWLLCLMCTYEKYMKMDSSTFCDLCRPGMNRCSIPEEHTTNALRALYHTSVSVPTTASENSHIQHSNSVFTSVGIATVCPVYPGQEHQSIDVQTATKSGKKKHESAEAANSTDLDGSTRSSSSRKKSLATNGKVNNLNSVKNSPSPNACGYPHPGRSSGIVEKCVHDKAKMSIISCSDGGIDLNVRSKQEADVEGSRASKRVRSEEMHFDDENWISDYGGTSFKGGHGSTSLSNHTPSDDRCKHRNRKDIYGVAEKKIVSDINAEIYVPSTSNNDVLHSGKFDDKDTIGKPISSSGKHILNSSDIMKAARESDCRKEKRARVSKSGKDISGRKTSVEADWKSRTARDQHNGVYVGNIQSDLGPLPSSVAANSSSSKVSGSHKNRTSGQEVKGSPVESVSSSPLRFLDADKVSSAKNNFVIKDDFDYCDFPSAASPRTLSDDRRGNGQTGTMKTDEILGADIAADKNAHLCRSSQHSSAKHFSEECNVEGKTNAGQSYDSGFYTKKSGMGLSSHFKDMAHASGSHLDKVGNRFSDSSNDSLGHLHSYEEKSKSRRNKSNEKFGTPSKAEKLIIQKYTAEGISKENGGVQTQRRFSYDGRVTAKNKEKKHNILEEHDKEKLPYKSNHTETHGSGKSHSLPPLARVHTDAAANGQPVSGFQKETAKKNSAVDEFDNGDASKAPNQKRKVETSNVRPVRLPTPTSHKVRDADAPSPIRRDSSGHAANNALKEAKDLKHMADRLKSSGSTESIGLYFQAALKFLNGASLLESGNSEATKHNETEHSMNIYSSTAKLCLFCAHEYEKLKDMAAAALAYKCVEVAYMRVVYSSHPSTSRDRNELQTALQIAPPGESPSSSASDVDNLNHAAPDKAALAKVGSPQVSGSHIISSRNRSGFLRILEFAENVNSAMEASRKLGLASAAATSRLAESSHKGVISSLRKALDYNFHDVEGLLRLVRVAMEAINRESC